MPNKLITPEQITKEIVTLAYNIADNKIQAQRILQAFATSWLESDIGGRFPVNSSEKV